MVHITIVSSGEDYPYARLHSADVPCWALGLVFELHGAQPDKPIVVDATNNQTNIHGSIPAIDLYDYLIGQYSVDPKVDLWCQTPVTVNLKGIFKPIDIAKSYNAINTNVIYFTRSE
jgi:hypothetical protein